MLAVSVSGKSKNKGYDVMMHFHADLQERSKFESAIEAFAAAVNLGFMITGAELITAVDKFINPRRAIANSLGELPPPRLAGEPALSSATHGQPE